ncbi:hypothetical protein TD95_001053 [Thielaviopsis punctulata]|uniref:Amine oxidase n=1 Tax=Thielaviopsis punctulata TaxID=72032 RepID=A0A0F4Z9E0_9PEZI|nr:hypothetical protein TD95_001053 [Thielaviopsis punctulata]
MATHPLDPLTPSEISQATALVRAQFPAHVLPVFRVCTLHEPPKALLFPVLDALARGQAPAAGLAVPRIARVHTVSADNADGGLTEFHVDLGAGKVVYREFKHGKYSYIDAEFMKKVQLVCLADEKVQQEIRNYEFPEESEVVVEPWNYSADGLHEVGKRTTMCWLYLRRVSHPDTNYYAYPLDLCAEVTNDKVTKIYRLPSSASDRIHNTPTKFDPRLAHSADLEYHPDLRPPPRTTTKPYRVIQPDGPSFSVTGHAVTWEKWTFRVGFNYREGLTLHDIRYDGRPLFYRIALSEMFVPYGDPRQPYPRKAAFDLGCDGAGINTNNLQLGCDCLGHIKYFDGWHVASDGSPLKMPNVICCHEQDDGILWKHTNFRSGNAVVTRSRVLVMQTIITVSNYEYIFAFYFGQDASLNYEVRATGILSTVPLNIDDPVPPYGIRVAPGAMAPYHQHLFCLRMDPMIDGLNNSLQVEESHALPIDQDDVHNPFYVGYTTQSSIVETEQGLDLDHTKARIFKIINEDVKNPITGTPVGYKLMPSYSQMLLAHPKSFHARRSEFGQHAVWVTRYQDHELYSAGDFLMESTEGDGIATAIARRKAEGGDASNVRKKDIVVWHTFGSTHNPRIEDWPVMPNEKMMVGLKPVNFFTANPGMDVAPPSQDVNKSVLVEGCCKN